MFGSGASVNTEDYNYQPASRDPVNIWSNDSVPYAMVVKNVLAIFITTNMMAPFFS